MEIVKEMIVFMFRDEKIYRNYEQIISLKDWALQNHAILEEDDERIVRLLLIFIFPYYRSAVGTGNVFQTEVERLRANGASKHYIEIASFINSIIGKPLNSSLEFLSKFNEENIFDFGFNEYKNFVLTGHGN